jgi:hypothetical protein
VNARKDDAERRIDGNQRKPPRPRNHIDEREPYTAGRTSIKVPAGYPLDLYWKGQPPREEYNYVLVDVKPGQKTKFTLTRYRPGSAEPFGTEALFT